jgi:hypothetical protein
VALAARAGVFSLKCHCARGPPRRGPPRVLGRVCVRALRASGPACVGRASVVAGRIEEIGFPFSSELSKGFII